MQTPNWHILGAGAIGSLWACHAYNSGRPMPLVFRDQQHLGEYQRAGGIMAQLDSSAVLLPVPASSPQTLTGKIDHLLVTTKANQTLAALENLASHINPSATLVLLQNGLGAAELASRRFPNATILQASTTVGAYRRGRFDLIQAGSGATLLGSVSNTPMAEANLNQLAASLSVGNLTVEPSADIHPVLWRKLAVNSVINPLTVKYRCRNGELLDNPLALQDMAELSSEFHQLSAAMGRGEWLDDALALSRQVAASTALNRSSMLQDVEAGRETEIDFINGHVCALAQQYHVDLPHHRQMLLLIRQQHH